MHAFVIGAGVIGVTTAWQLAKNGWQVTLVDAQGEPAAVTSHANGGQLSYSYVAPLADPGVLPHLPEWLLRRESPLRFTPRLDPAQWAWCLKFLRACNSRTATESTAQMLTLSYLSRNVLHEWLHEVPLEFSHAAHGKLIVYRSAALLDKTRSLVAYQAEHGSSQQVLDADSCVSLEPALASVQHDIAGAVYTPSEESGDCAQFTHQLFDRLSTLKSVEIRMGDRVRRLHRAGGDIQGVLMEGGEVLQADHYVVAAGMGSVSLLEPLGSRPALYPLKGFSLSVPCAPETPVPTISVTDYERKTVYARLGSTLRIAAMVGIGSRDTRIEADRIALLRRQVSELLPGLDLTEAQAWAGQRPATPDGRPLIGRSRAAGNLWLNIGHGALGFTLACGSSRLLSDLMEGREPSIEAHPFQPAC
ncbi:MAG TPA: D-amino acid dehydrogenase [Castellaniella sp.]|uniref:D-amino acid dehydrogenase n=1 Tax=Castellaniella sp. TaxID=1955812 RepID=UPI002F0B8AFD